MFKLVIKNFNRRRLRSFLTATGIAAAVAVLLLIDQITTQYQKHLFAELSSMGIHVMLVPLGCPYDAAARVLQGNQLEHSIPETALDAARGDGDVDVAAPLLVAAVPRLDVGRTDMFVGLDESGIKLRSWWKAARGSAGFTQTNAVVLGADAAESEMREPGDLLYSRELGRTFTVAGILERSGMSDDSLFFIPLRTAQAIFNSTNRLTAVAIRLKDPEELMPTAARLQNIPGAQVVTQTEMMGTFLNILGTVRTLLRSIGAVALCASIVGLMNVLFISVAERSYEFSLFRALGASRWQIFRVVLLEATLLTGAGIALGIVAALSSVPAIRVVAQRHLAFDPTWGLPVGQSVLGETLVLGFVVAGVASVLPAWRASRMQPAQALKGAD